MRLRLDDLDALVAELADLSIESLRAIGSRSHLAHRQRFLADLLIDSYMGNRAHDCAEGASSFGSIFLMKGLRAESPVCTKLLERFWSFPQGHKGYSVKHHKTKSYYLKPEVRLALDRVLNGERSMSVCRADTGKQVEPRSLSKSGLPKKLGLRFQVPSIVPLTVEQVDRAIMAVDEWRQICGDHGYLDQDKNRGTTLLEARNKLRVVRTWVLSLGGLPNFYLQSSNGRLSPGNGPAPHVIRLPAMLRRLLFADTPWVDWDLRSAHYSVFLSLAKARGLETPNLDTFMNDRDAMHSHMMTVADCRCRDNIKGLTLSWLAGGTLSSSEYTSSGEAIGSDGMEALKRDDRTRDLYEEIQRTSKKILKAWSHGTIVNAVDCRLSQTGASTGKQISHICSGLESFAVRAMCEQVPGLVAVIYDGWISQDANVRALEEHVRDISTAQLGYPLHINLKKQPFATEIPTPIAAPYDF
jgi:hypothetical protein